MLQRLQEHHGWMLALLREGEPMFAQTRPPSAFLLATRRNAMGRLLTAYQKFLHQEVLEPLLQSGSAEHAAIARAIKVDCIEMTERFRSFQRRWIVQDAVERWDEYRQGAVQMRDRLQHHVEKVAALARQVSAR